MSTYSLVITNFNRENFLARAIRSCLNQMVIREEIEVIVVDDGSTDNSIEICEEFKDNITLSKFNSNKGVASASNEGLRLSNSPFWIRVDSDDYISQFACHFMGSILKSNQEFDFVYCDHIRVNVQGVSQEIVKLNSKEKLLNHGAGVMFRKDALEKLGGYDETLKNAEDYDLLHRLIDSGSRGYYLPVPLYRYYIHGKNITLSGDREKFKRIIREKYGI